MKRKGMSILEIIISIALISLIMVFLIRLLLLVRSEDNLNLSKSNVNVISSTVLSEIHDDFNSKGLYYVYKPICVNTTSSNTNNCCCNYGDFDCLKFYFKTGEKKYLSVMNTNGFNDTIMYGKVKRVLPNGYSFLSPVNYIMSTVNKYGIGEVGNGLYQSAPPTSNYKIDSLTVISIPIYQGSLKYDAIEIRDGYSHQEIQTALGSSDGSLLRDTCPE